MLLYHFFNIINGMHSGIKINQKRHSGLWRITSGDTYSGYANAGLTFTLKEGYMFGEGLWILVF